MENKRKYLEFQSQELLKILHKNNIDLSQLKTINSHDAFNLICSELEGIIQPTLITKFGSRNIHYSSDWDINRRVKKRALILSEFLQKIDEILETNFGTSKIQDIEFLDGDSHNLGTKPIMFRTSNQEFVLKQSDPRPFELLREICGEVEKGTNICLSMPKIIQQCVHNSWYVTPFLCRTMKVETQSVADFMISLGALMAIAFALHLVDIHLENVLAVDGTPIIIDPECIFYISSDIPHKSRLFATGLIAPEPTLSSSRGGLGKVEAFDQSISSDGILKFKRIVDRKAHLFQSKDGGFIDPAQHEKCVLTGFTLAFEEIMKKKCKYKAIVNDIVEPDFRVRWLVRKTRHYSAILQALSIPKMRRAPQYRKKIIEAFSNSGSLMRDIAQPVLEAEIQDMDNGDIPYFWVRADSTYIYHRTGTLGLSDLESTIISQIENLFHDFTYENLEYQKNLISNFLKLEVADVVG